MRKIIVAPIILSVIFLTTLSLIIPDGNAEIKSQKKVEGEWIKLTDGRIVLVQD